MSNDEFTGPGSSVGIQWDTLKGALLVIEPHEIEKDVKTEYGVSDATRSNVYVLDGEQAGAKYAEVFIFPKVLQSQLRPRFGSKVLGRLGQGEAKGKQSPPWKLIDATDDERKQAKEWLSRQIVDADKPPF